ncbi:hypothetical protein RHGRI_021441 [Rhododendron griersonianum]|uniref:Deoxyribodipyrimidine photo-lyase n=1 Tax=Rhododendron griersonianum TaxID=479676 RepID=A0AAV6JK78_9ERIC|nr:hypothetical protein RHGRI_021441 [Rhododendron griersonianum]
MSSMAQSNTTVQPGRIRVLKKGSRPLDHRDAAGPVVYWMFRDQRVRDNWALIHAVDEANKANVPVAVGEAIETIPNFIEECGASLLVCDFSPLREVKCWKEEICKRVSDSVSVHEVDAHNVVPLWVASEKLEYSARTIRGKINKLLPEYMIDFPKLGPPIKKWASTNHVVDWENLITAVIRKGAEVPELEWCEPGEDAAMEVLMGNRNGFLTKRLKGYSSDRNNPLKPKALSGLSPYLHFGQISAQRCATEARKVRTLCPQVCGLKASMECFSVGDGSLRKDAWLYEAIRTVSRMYWAKKILEWTSGPEEALAISIYLNDKYEIDGRDPSGYVGCMWSICGVHDQGWRERPVFGKIRYMNYAGCKRKFDVDGYISYVKRLVGEIKKRKAVPLFNGKGKELRI